MPKGGKRTFSKPKTSAGISCVTGQVWYTTQPVRMCGNNKTAVKLYGEGKGGQNRQNRSYHASPWRRRCYSE